MYLHTRTADSQWSLFLLKYRFFGLGETNWPSIIQPLFLQKKLCLYIRVSVWGYEFEFGSQRIRVSVVRDFIQLKIHIFFQFVSPIVSRFWNPKKFEKLEDLKVVRRYGFRIKEQLSISSTSTSSLINPLI